MKLRSSLPGILAVAGLLSLASTTALQGQIVLENTQNLDFDRPEAWAMKYFASVNLLTGLGAPRALDPGKVYLELEGAWVPPLSESERTVGFNGTKVEDLNKTSVFLRPRAVIGLPRKYSLTLSWVPPIEVNGVEPNLLGIAIGRPVHEASSWRIGLRGYAQYGTLQADFTCPEDVVAAGNDPGENPFNCVEPSNDEHQIGAIGAELSWAYQEGGSARWEPHLGISANYLDMEFQVDARHSGFVDRTLLLADGWTFSVTAGVTYHASERWKLVGEAFYSPLDVVRPPSSSTQNDALVNIRSMISYKIR